MRNWGYLVAILYIIMLVAIILPVLNVCFELNTKAGEMFSTALYSWGFWLGPGVLFLYLERRRRLKLRASSV